MRQIKFREPIFNNDGSFDKFHYWGFVDEGSFTGISDLDIAKEKSQEYTGLKDKNNKEIYEGDVYVNHIGNTNYINFVEFKADVGYELGEMDIKGKINSVRIIGNIYENPELIKNE